MSTIETRPPRAVVTGANGFVASNLIAVLLDQGTDVCALARGGRDRVVAALDAAVTGTARGDAWSGEMIEFDLGEPQLGISAADAELAFREPCDFWHIAANVSLSPNRADSLWETNHGGTTRALDLFAAHAKPGSRFMYVSTAYVCGVCEGDAPEAWFPADDLGAFRTVYEATKRAAEIEVRDRAEQGGMDVRVFRLGQVVGDSVSGVCTSSAGVYQVLDDLTRVHDAFPDETVRIEIGPETTANLVPIDLLVDWLVRLAQAPAPEGDPIVHLTDERGLELRRLVDIIREELGLPIHAATPADFEAEPATQIERLVATRIRNSGRYFAEPIGFSRANLVRALGVDEPACDEDTFRRLLTAYGAKSGAPQGAA